MKLRLQINLKMKLKMNMILKNIMVKFVREKKKKLFDLF